MIRKNNATQAGLTIIEVLFAIIIFAIAVLGSLNFQSAILYNLSNKYRQLEAERIAFQLLDIYPDTIRVQLPEGWQYQINKRVYYDQCELVSVTVILKSGEKIQQQRLFC